MGDNINIKDLLLPLEESLKEIQVSLQTSIDKINSSIAQVKAKFDEKFKFQDEQIGNLQTNVGKIEAAIEANLKSKDTIIENLLIRVKKLEKMTFFNTHIIAMHERKLDDQEQISRKTNLRITGIEVGPKDSPANIMSKIKDEATALDLKIPDSQYDRCHRIGRRFMKGGKTIQPVLLKLCSWSARDLLYQNRKNFSFKISADLTSRRHELLDFAIDEISISDDLYVDYVFADKNCKLKVKSKTGKYLGFNAKSEFYSIMYRLRFEHFASEGHLADIAVGKEIHETNDLYY